MSDVDFYNLLLTCYDNGNDFLGHYFHYQGLSFIRLMNSSNDEVCYDS